MSFKICDYKTDIRNVLVTPQIRSRFLQMQPGQVAQPHSHDLGHEVFLVLEGRCDFEIDGESQELRQEMRCGKQSAKFLNEYIVLEKYGTNLRQEQQILRKIKSENKKLRR